MRVGFWWRWEWELLKPACSKCFLFGLRLPLPFSVVFTANVAASISPFPARSFSRLRFGPRLMAAESVQLSKHAQIPELRAVESCQSGSACIWLCGAP